MASENKLIGVIGAGMMGHRIAISFARAGYDVILIDKTDYLVNRRLKWIQSDLNTLVDNQLLSSKIAETIGNNSLSATAASII
jgi:3-hydroxybutyryl-CoA dehydrogenase